MMEINVEYHTHDGFTLYALDKSGYLVHRRFIGYSLFEAKELFMEEMELI